MVISLSYRRPLVAATTLLLLGLLLLSTASASSPPQPAPAAELCRPPSSGPSAETRKHTTAAAQASRPRKATFRAQRRATLTVTAKGNALGSYLTSEEALPRLMYAAKYEKVGGGRYRCEIDPIQFFSLHLVPMLDTTLGIDVQKRQVSLTNVTRGVRRAKASEAVGQSSKGVGFIHKGEVNHSSFSMVTQARTTWTPVEEGKWCLTTEQTLEVSMERPAWLLVPSSVLNRAGNMVLSQVLRTATPDYLHKLRTGYVTWSEATQQAKAFSFPKLPTGLEPFADNLKIKLKELQAKF